MSEHSRSITFYGKGAAGILTICDSSSIDSSRFNNRKSSMRPAK